MPSPSPTAGQAREHNNENASYALNETGPLEGADSVVRNVKRRARGFRDMDYFATMVYLTCGKLDLKAVTTSPSVRVFLQIGPYPHLVTACIITIILIVIQ